MGTRKEERLARQAQRNLRRKLGLNLGALVEAAKAVRAKDCWTGDAETDCASILAEFISANKTAVASEMVTVGIDWDTIMEWIEKLMPLILLILSLF